MFLSSQDYQNYNKIQLSELEIFYRMKFNSVQNNFRNNEEENNLEELKQLIEQNRMLRRKLSKR